MKLSIVIVSYNVKELLIKCLESIEKAAKNIDHEVIVVDNDSRDETVPLIQEKFNKIKLIANKNNLGFSKANNQGIKISKGEYILILNPDTELLTDTLDKMLNFMDKLDDNVGITTCKVELPNGQLDKDCRRSFPTPWRALTHFSGLSKIFKKTKLFDSYYIGYLPTSEQIEVDACVGAFMLIRAKALKDTGYFDENFFFYGEDLDLCYRMKDKGYKILYTPITKILHYKGASSGIKQHSQKVSKATLESKKKSVIESTRAMELFYKKHYLKKYPMFLTSIILLSINFVKTVRLLRLYLL